MVLGPSTPDKERATCILGAAIEEGFAALAKAIRVCGGSRQGWKWEQRFQLQEGDQSHSLLVVAQAVVMSRCEP